MEVLVFLLSGFDLDFGLGMSSSRASAFFVCWPLVARPERRISSLVVMLASLRGCELAQRVVRGGVDGPLDDAYAFGFAYRP